jgi:LacI family transcriptional regulator
VPNLRNPTVYDVAAQAGVSISTVSRVLNAPKLVKLNTRERVMKAIDDLGYVPHAEATARARKAARRIGVLSPFFTFPSFIQRMRGVATFMADTPNELIVYPVDSLDRLDGYLSMLAITRRLDGLILMSMGLSDQAARRLLENRLETVLIELRHPDFSSILIDDYQGGCLAADYLHRRGHQKCAFFGPANLPDYSIHPEEARLNGFRDGLRNRGVDLPPELILLSSQSVVLVRRELNLLMDSAAPPTAIFAASDSIAISILRAARESGIRVPEDLAVVGFDDIDMAEQIGLTTVRQSLDESGRMAAELLTAQLADPNRPPQTIQLGLKLVERETA